MMYLHSPSVRWKGMKTHGLYVLVGLVVLSISGLASHSKTVDIRLHGGTQLEERGREQLRRLLQTYDLSRWLFTHKVLIQSRVIPHSHPVLTLNTRYIEDDTAQLATFVHEQLHWFLTEHAGRQEMDTANSDLRKLYPKAPTEPPEGARGEESTYLHLIVCYLELQSLTELIGENRAREHLASIDHYTWVYRTVLADAGRIGELVTRHGLAVPER